MSRYADVHAILLASGRVRLSLPRLTRALPPARGWREVNTVRAALWGWAKRRGLKLHAVVDTRTRVMTVLAVKPEEGGIRLLSDSPP